MVGTLRSHVQSRLELLDWVRIERSMFGTNYCYFMLLSYWFFYLAVFNSLYYSYKKTQKNTMDLIQAIACFEAVVQIFDGSYPATNTLDIITLKYRYLSGYPYCHPRYFVD